MARTTASIAPWADEVVDRPEPVSIEELERLSDEETGWYELVEGWLVKLSPGSGGHGSLTLRLASDLHQYVRAHRLGEVLAAETGFTLSPPGARRPTVLGPDVAFVRTERLPPRDSEAWDHYLRLAPDLAVEVVSPSQSRSELNAKARIWIGHGTRLVWVVAPRQKEVDVWFGNAEKPVRTLRVGDALDGLHVIPGYAYPLAELFD
jgi:Uma2 family endonuclease